MRASTRSYIACYAYWRQCSASILALAQMHCSMLPIAFSLKGPCHTYLEMLELIKSLAMQFEGRLNISKYRYGNSIKIASLNPLLS